MFSVIKPICFSDQEMIENCESKTHQNASADSTVGTMKGISTIARSIALMVQGSGLPRTPTAGEVFTRSHLPPAAERVRP